MTVGSWPPDRLRAMPRRRRRARGGASKDPLAPAVPNDSVEIAVYSPITGRTHEGPSVEVPLLGFWLACRHRTPRMPPFAIRARCHAAAHFDWDDVLRLNYPEGQAAYQSEYTGGEGGRAYAVTIHGEIRGEAASLKEAEFRLASALRAPFPALAVASNAAMGEMLLVSSHGLDLSQPQPFLGYWTPGPDEWFPPGERRIDLRRRGSCLWLPLANHTPKCCSELTRPIDGRSATGSPKNCCSRASSSTSQPRRLVGSS